MNDDIGLHDAYSLKSASDVKRLYSRWADTFEEDFIVEHGYVYHRHVVEEFTRRADLDPTEAILDVGCGTGVGGVELRRRGPWPVDGLDLSPEMLAKATDKVDGAGTPIYRHLFEANVLEPLNIGDGSYGGV
ncbi:MAG: methyltransferase domain-containing protein, partial [Acidimicrobiia bacterium]|nr:methyltransferase domain-containing protein [Acidimicrobiia bacterium]